MAAFVLDKRKKSLIACPERRACVRRHPFTIRVKDRVGGDRGPVRVKIDSGSNITGVAIITDEGAARPPQRRCLFELPHRGRQISEALTARWAGDYRRTKLTTPGFPRGYGMRTTSVRGLRTGAMGRAEVPKGSQAAIHVGRNAVRASGSSRVRKPDRINATRCKRLHRADGDGYAWRPARPARAEGRRRGRPG